MRPWRRTYFEHRGAYAPRAWIGVAAGMPVGVAVTVALRLSFWEAGGVGFAIAVVIQHVQWTLWRRAHPVRPLEDVRRRQRQEARWN